LIEDEIMEDGEQTLARIDLLASSAAKTVRYTNVEIALSSSLREALAHFLVGILDPPIQRWGSSYNGDVHSSTGVSLPSKAGEFRQKNDGFFAEETTCSRNHERRKQVPTLLSRHASRHLLFFSRS
jgi:hypothetical protein